MLSRGQTSSAASLPCPHIISCGRLAACGGEMGPAIFGLAHQSSKKENFRLAINGLKMWILGTKYFLDYFCKDQDFGISVLGGKGICWDSAVEFASSNQGLAGEAKLWSEEMGTRGHGPEWGKRPWTLRSKSLSPSNSTRIEFRPLIHTSPSSSPGLHSLINNRLL